MRNTYLFTVFLGLSWSTPAIAAEAEQPTLDGMSASLEKSLTAIDDDNDGKVPLLNVIRAVRPLGFGAQSNSESSVSTGRGRGQRNRGGRGMSRGASGSEAGGQSRGGRRGREGEASQGQAASPTSGRGGRGGFDPVERFKSFDQDGDGLLKGDEINARLTGSKYAEDGEVSLEEFQAAFEEMRTSMSAGGGHNHGGGSHGGGGQGPGGQRGGNRGAPTATTSEDAALLVSFDQNRDRVIELPEIKLALSQEVERLIQARMTLDKDQDGAISKAEFAAQVESDDPATLDEDGFDRRTRMMFNREDTDQDGAITEEEIKQQVLQQTGRRVLALGYCLEFADLDANRDQQISADEVTKLGSTELSELLAISGEEPLPCEAFYATIYRRLSRR